MHDHPIRTSFWNGTSGHCDCCGHASQTIWGGLAGDDGPLAAWFAGWTVGRPDHMPTIDLVLGPWGEGTRALDRVLVSLRYRPAQGGGALMVVDAAGGARDRRDLCGRALARNEVVGTPLAGQVFALIDALWLTEPRMAAVRSLDDLA